MIVVVLSNKAFEPGNYSPFIFSWLLPTCRGLTAHSHVFTQSVPQTPICSVLPLGAPDFGTQCSHKPLGVM